MKTRVCVTATLLLAAVTWSCGSGEQPAGESPPDDGGDAARAEAPLDMDPKPAIDGFSRWDLECPFPFSFQYPEGWSRGEASDRGVELTSAEGGRVSIGVYGEMGDEAAEQWRARMASELELATTIEVGGAEAPVYSTGGSGYWVIAPFRRTISEPVSGLPGSGGAVTYVAILEVGRSDDVDEAVVMEILGSLEPNGCELMV